MHPHSRTSTSYIKCKQANCSCNSHAGGNLRLGVATNNSASQPPYHYLPTPDSTEPDTNAVVTESAFAFNNSSYAFGRASPLQFELDMTVPLSLSAPKYAPGIVDESSVSHIPFVDSKLIHDLLVRQEQELAEMRRRNECSKAVADTNAIIDEESTAQRKRKYADPSPSGQPADATRVSSRIKQRRSEQPSAISPDATKVATPVVSNHYDTRVCLWGACSETFTDLASFVHHFRSIHITPHRYDKFWYCQWRNCNLTHMRMRANRRNPAVEHGLPAVSAINAGNAAAKQSHLAGFDRRDRYLLHVRWHSGDLPYVCPEPACLARFRRKDHRTQHLRHSHPSNAKYLIAYLVQRDKDWRAAGISSENEM